MKLTTMRLVKILICLAIVLAVVPMMAFAAEESDSIALLSESETVLTDTAVVTEDNIHDGVQYIWFATGNGTLTVNLSDYEFGWWYSIDCGNGSESFNNKYDTVPASYSVTNGAMVTINVGAYDPEYYLKLYGADLGGECVAGSVSIELSFVESGEGGGEVVIPVQPGESQDNPKVIGSSEWTFIAPGQTVWYCYDNTDNMMLNGSYSQMLNISASTDYSVTYKDMDVPVDADGYVNYEMFDMIMMGKYIFSITNNGTEESFFSISVADKPKYVNTYLNVELGDTTVSLDSSATYTLYEFQPAETGVYLITIPEEAGVIGDWGASHFPQDKTEDKTNTLTWTCTSVGQSMLIGISGYDAEVVLTIERTGDYVPAPVIEWTVVENQEFDQVKDMVFSEDEVVAIDVTDDIEDLVFDVGGLLRYGSPSGPIVVTYLDGSGLIGLYDAYYYGQLKYVEKDGDGQVVARYDCNEAILEYLEAGIIPMTNELSIMLHYIGADKGWYDASVPGFYLFDTTVNPETAYLGFCGYIEGTELVADELGTEVEGEFESDGDVSDTVVLFPAADGVVSVQIKDCVPGFQFIVYENAYDFYTFVEGDETGIYTFEVTAGNVYDIYLVPAEYDAEFESFFPAAGSISYKLTYAETAVEEEPDEPIDPPDDPDDPEDPEDPEDPIPGTGDMGLGAALVALMVATAGVVVLTKKKEY